MDAHEFPSIPGPPTAVMFGNGQTSVTHDHASIGELPAIVCDDNDLKEDLVSVNPLLDSGYKLTMESEFGTLFNEETQQTIHVRRDGPRWSVDLRDLAQAGLHDPKLESNVRFRGSPAPLISW